MGDGNPAEAATILIEAFWLIAVLIKVIFSIIVVFITAILFIVLSFILSALNFFLEWLQQEPISSTFLLNMQEDALDGVEVLYQGVIQFLHGFRTSVEDTLNVKIIWDPTKTFGGGIEIIAMESLDIVIDTIQFTQAVVQGFVEIGQDIIEDIFDFFG
jgi:hypothetical protein